MECSGSGLSGMWKYQQGDIRGLELERVETRMASAKRDINPRVRINTGEREPWGNHKRDFKLGDRVLVCEFRIGMELNDIKIPIQEINIIEVSTNAIKTKEYGWILKEWDVRIIDVLDMGRNFLPEKM